MTTNLLRRILRESGVSELLSVLSERLSPSDFQSLLLEVYRQRAARRSPAQLLDDYEHNRFVRRSQTSAEALLNFDQHAYALAAPLFEPLELAPVCPFGTISVVSAVDQNSTIATIRNTELVSDSTNVLALECAVRRRAYLLRADQRHMQVRLCTSHRLLRAQNFKRAGTLAHFRLFALCTAGRDEGSYRFELGAVTEHLSFYVHLLSSLQHSNYTIHNIRVTVTDWSDLHSEQLSSRVLEPLSHQFSHVHFELDPTRAAGRDYYDGVCFHMYAKDDTNADHTLVDGGFTTWTQQFLSNKKERLLISGIGSERICNIFQAAQAT